MPLWFAILAAIVAPALGWLAWRRFRSARGIVVDERGILEPNRGWGFIPWEEIEGAYTPSAADSETLHVRLRVSHRLAGVLRERRTERQAARDGSVEIRLDLSGSELSAVELLHEILARRPAPGRSR